MYTSFATEYFNDRSLIFRRAAIQCTNAVRTENAIPASHARASLFFDMAKAIADAMNASAEQLAMLECR